ncbi:MAG: Sensory box histidine kinase/response regulator [Myxococcales bacterium]|nr:Sensory box histidine kinase/response regulator [Myxococcales bacterium]
MSGPTLHTFLAVNREEILERSRWKLVGRDAAAPSGSQPADGLALFLDQLIAILDAQSRDLPTAHLRVSESASLHGEELLRRGLTVGQVVQDYGSICQSVTEVASERHAAITAEEFRMFNQCLDEAIAQAVTAYEHERDPTVGGSKMTQLGGLAHEMRNLLTTSMLTFDAICKGSVGINGTTGAMLRRSLQGMRALIDRTLAEVRLGAGIESSEPVAIGKVMEEIEVIATLQAREYGVEISIEPCALDVAVQGDRQVLVAAVANVVQNACKFSPKGSRVSVSTRSTEGRILIEVQDQCGGLPTGKAEALFLPFEQHGTDRTGLGLGLSIALKAVRSMGGQMSARDFPGRGCVFTIDLPRSERPSPEAPALDVVTSAAAALLPVAAAVSALPSVLVVDDDDDLRAALEALLSTTYRVTSARDGAEALTALRHAPFDLAIVDLELPIVDGLTVVRTIRARPHQKMPAFLFLSGQSNPRVKAEALALGEVDYMAKPFDPDELLAKMSRMLATATRESRLRADAMTDSLTGLANSRCFTHTLDREIERSRRYGLPLSLIVLDLDHMKVINDQHGQAAGDEALRMIARVIAKTVRSCELVARQGGDEFAVILPNTGAEEARKAAIRLHVAVGAQTILGWKLSASLGLVSWQNRGGAAERHVQSPNILEASEEALDRAKNAGRDRIESRQM